MNWWAKYLREYSFLDGGRHGRQVDCYGLVMEIFAREIEVALPEWPDLTLDRVTGSGGDLLEDRFTADFSPIRMGLEQAFDVAVIEKALPVDGKLKRGPWHVGIVTRPGHLLHIDLYTGVVELPFRDSATARAHVTCREKHVRLFRHHSREMPE